MESLSSRLTFINESLASIRENRPGWRGQYTMGPTLSEAQLAAFEATHRCLLPLEYREFLRVVGDGGCGVYSLHQHFSGSVDEDCQAEAVDLSAPFPHLSGWPDESYSMEELNDPRHVAGSLLIGEIGCGMYDRIIITGPDAGQIWADMRGNGGIYPYVNETGDRVLFLDWFLDWFEIDAWRYACPGLGRQAQRSRK